MRTEEELLVARYGRKRPFKVPEGYFDNIESRIMARLPERESRLHERRVVVRKYYRYAVAIAASVCIAIFGVALYADKTNADSSLASNFGNINESATISDNIDYVAEYTMFDNDDIYAMMSDY